MVFLWGIAAWLMVFSLRNPTQTAEAARAALFLCAEAVIPSLFVFAVGAKLLVGANFTGFLTRLPIGGVCRLFGISRAGLSAVLIGLFSGFPVGAAVLADLVRRGEMERQEAEDLMPFCNGAGASFVVGTVGGAFFGSVKVGALLLFSQTAATVTALFLSAERRRHLLRTGENAFVKKASFSSVLTSAVGEGALAMVFVSGFVVFFSVFSFSLSFVFGGENRIFLSLLGSFLEISGGLSTLCGQKLFPPSVCVGLVGFFLGFGGISVMMQAADRAEAAEISMKKYFLGKLWVGVLCGVFSFLCAYLL